MHPPGAACRPRRPGRSRRRWRLRRRRGGQVAARASGLASGQPGALSIGPRPMTRGKPTLTASRQGVRRGGCAGGPAPTTVRGSGTATAAVRFTPTKAGHAPQAPPEHEQGVISRLTRGPVAAVVLQDDRPSPRRGEDEPLGVLGARPRPCPILRIDVPEDRPHGAPGSLTHHIRRPVPVGRAEELRAPSRPHLGNRPRRPIELGRRPPRLVPEVGVRPRVVAKLVALGGGAPEHVLATCDLLAADEERRPGAVPAQEVEDLRRGLVGPVVERHRDLPAPARPALDRPVQRSSAAPPS